MIMELKDLTPEQRQALIQEAMEAEKEKLRQKEADRQTYKELVSEKVDQMFPVLEEISGKLAEQKKQVYDEFSVALEMKRKLYDVKENQCSHAFMNADGTRRITLGCYVVDSYDDTVNDGIAIVKEYISGLARDENSRMLVETVMKLLAKDQKGSLKPSRVMQLRNMADRSGDPRFMEGVAIIANAYKPMPSKTFIRAEVKDENGAWKSVPLGMTEA